MSLFVSKKVLTVENVEVARIACALPKDKYTLIEYAPNLFDEKRAKRMARGTGFTKLRIAPKEMTTSDLCKAAAEQLLEDIDKDTVKGLVFVSQTPDYTSPATCHVLQYQLGLGHDIFCMDVSEGCSGWVRGVYVAGLICQNSQAPVLLLAGDTLSKHTSPDDSATRGIFGDAGVATLLMPGKHSIPFLFQSYGEQKDAIKLANYFQLRQKSHREGLGSLFSYIDGGAIMDFALAEVLEAIEEYLATITVSKEDIGLCACHQANKLILNNLADKLGIPRTKVPFTAGEIGNESSASIPLVLSSVSGEMDLSSSLCVGFGVGMSVGLAYCDFSNTRFYPTLEL